jgi:hypothetical protein
MILQRFKPNESKDDCNVTDEEEEIIVENKNEDFHFIMKQHQELLETHLTMALGMLKSMKEHPSDIDSNILPLADDEIIYQEMV